jgi:hypothetical protein
VSAWLPNPPHIVLKGARLQAVAQGFVKGHGFSRADYGFPINVIPSGAG